MIGKTLLHYQVIEKLGEGGMGIVYKARDTHLDRFVAIKILPESVADPVRRARFEQEAKAASALQHPNIIAIHDIASAAGHNFIVMEYVAGTTLDQLIARGEPKLRDALQIATQTADALARAHSAGIIHRDLKPSNIMIDEHGLVKLVDFGLAKLVATNPAPAESTMDELLHTTEGAILGTVSYMSPEQAEGRPVDPRSDIFSFGAVLYEMLTGRRPFTGDSTLSVLASVLNCNPPSPGDRVPPDLQQVVMRCLRKDPARRWQSMADVKAALEDIGQESAAAKPAPPLERPRRRAWLPAVLGAVAVLVVMLAAWFWYSRAHGAGGPDVLEAVPFTTYPGSQLMPAFSPDGTQAAFVWCREQGCAVYVKQIAIEEPYRLSKPPDNAFAPQWSPDGAYIAFQRRVSSANRGVSSWTSSAVTRYEYVVVPQRGGAERVVARFPAPRQVSIGAGAGALAWTPDSKSLIVVGTPSGDQFAALYAVSVVTGERRTLLDRPSVVADVDPAVSPDGKWLAFCRITSQVGSDLYLLPLTPGPAGAGAPLKVKVERELASLPTWLPDGRELIFSGGSAARTDLLRVAAGADARPQRLPLAERSSGSASISRQGRLLYTSARAGNVNLFRVTGSGTAGKWSAPERFSSSTLPEIEPQFSPDGSKIAVSSARSGSPQIWLFDSDGSNPISLTSAGPQSPTRPRWSPDGQWIAFYGTANGNVDLYVVSPNGGPVRRLTNSPGRDMNPAWSCDSRYVYYQSDREQFGETWKLPLSGGAPMRVMPARRGAAFETPDCKYLVYETGWPDQYAIWRKPLPDGDPQLLADSVYPNGGFQVFPDGTYYVANPGAAIDCPILFRNASTGVVRELARIANPYWGFTVSPDRKTVLYSAGEVERTNLMMVEGFR